VAVSSWPALKSITSGSPSTIDLAFPLFAPSFCSLLPRFVAGEIEAIELEQAAATTGIDERVLGVLPPRVRYVGRPVWAERDSVDARATGV
jgi:hypothetical protein